MGTIQRILVATDLSAISASIYEVAADLVARTKADLVVAHIADPEEYRETLREVQMGVDEYLERYRSTVLFGIRKVVGEDLPIRVEVVMRGRSVAAELLDLAALTRADLIIMGTHGRTGLPRMLLGSVAEDVIRHTQTPVLVVPMMRRPAERPVTAASGAPGKQGLP